MRRRMLMVKNGGGNKVEYEFVDLGLSVKWATCNIGATKPEESGLYFQWGDTQGWTAEQVANGEKVFDWEHYKWCNGSINTITKYNDDPYNGIVDNKFTLDIEDDAAHVLIGGGARMPTKEEYEELLKGCTYVEIANYNGSGIGGILFTSKQDTSKTLFFPHTSVYRNSVLWTRTFDSYGLCFVFDTRIDYVDTDTDNRCSGHVVRAVLPK